MLLVPVTATSQPTAPSAYRSVTDFGVSAANADNSSQMQAAINWAEANLATIHIPINITIANTLVINAQINGQGFGIVGPGRITMTSTTQPIIRVDGTTTSQSSVVLQHLPLGYATYAQYAPGPDCILFTGAGFNSFYNSKLDDIECTAAYRGFETTGAYNLWGNRWTNVRCKGVTGACFKFDDIAAGGLPNNYFGNIYAISSGCWDLYQFYFSNQDTLSIDNMEVNTTSAGCNLLSLSGGTQRSINIRNIRCETCTVTSLNIGQAMIQSTGTGVHIEGFEVQTLYMTVAGNYYLFAENGPANSPPDVVTNVHLWQDAPSPAGTLYGVQSPSVRVYLQPVVNWVGAASYVADAAPGSQVVPIYAGATGFTQPLAHSNPLEKRRIEQLPHHDQPQPGHRP